MLGLLGAPGRPACGRAAGVVQFDAIDRTHGNAQFASRAVGCDHRVHELVGPQDGIRGAGLDAQGATDAPGLVDHGHGARGFHAVLGAQRNNRPTRQCGQPFHARSAARWALVDASLARGHGLGVAGAVRVAATRALRLRQRGVYARCQIVAGEHGGGGHGVAGLLGNQPACTLAPRLRGCSAAVGASSLRLLAWPAALAAVALSGWWVLMNSRTCG